MKYLKLFILILITGLILAGCFHRKSDVIVLSAPAGKRFTRINTDGITVIPNGRFITPQGKCITVAPHPFGLALSHDGMTAVTANSGVKPLSVSIIHNPGHNPEIIQVPPGYSNDAGVLESVFMGLAISPDDSKVYVSGGQENSILVFDLQTGQKIDSIDCSICADSTDYPDGYIGDMTLTKDGRYLYAVDQMNFRIAVIDTHSGKVIRSVGVGRYPFGITLADDEKKLYVANVGMFKYSKIGNIEATSDYKHALSFPAFGYNTKEMINGITTDSLVTFT